MPIEQLAGPAALAIAASLAVIALWKNHERNDALKDRTIETLTVSVGQFPAALKDLTAVVTAATARERDRTSDSG